MQIPNVPTDNLYKFIAISGLALFIFSISSILYLQKNKYENLINLAEKNDLNAADSIKAMDSIFYYNKLLIIEKNDFKNKFGFFYDSLNLETIKLKSGLKANVERILTIELQLKKMKSVIEYEKAELNIRNEIEKIKSTLYGILYLLLYLLIFLGLAFSFFGFIQWYFKTQKYYDKKLKKDSLIEFNYLEKSNALKDTYKIYYEILPIKSHEGEDWDDALTTIVLRLPQIQKQLEIFREKYSAILPKDVTDVLTKSINLCNVAASLPNSELNKLANNIYNNQADLIISIGKLIKEEIE